MKFGIAKQFDGRISGHPLNEISRHRLSASSGWLAVKWYAAWLQSDAVAMNQMEADDMVVMTAGLPPSLITPLHKSRGRDLCIGIDSPHICLDCDIVVGGIADTGWTDPLGTISLRSTRSCGGPFEYLKGRAAGLGCCFR